MSFLHHWPWSFLPLFSSFKMSPPITRVGRQADWTISTLGGTLEVKGNPVQDDRLLSSQLLLAFVNWQSCNKPEALHEQTDNWFSVDVYNSMNLEYLPCSCPVLTSRLHGKNKVKTPLTPTTNLQVLSRMYSINFTSGCKILKGGSWISLSNNIP